MVVAMVYYPTMSFLFEWFLDKRGLANGIMYSGTGESIVPVFNVTVPSILYIATGGVIFPFLLNKLLQRYGQRTTLLSMAVAFAVLMPLAFHFAKPRLPPSQHTPAHRKIDTSFVKRKAFWILFTANFLQGFGNFMPYLYIPSKTISRSHA